MDRRDGVRAVRSLEQLLALCTLGGADTESAQFASVACAHGQGSHAAACAMIL